MIFVYVKHSQRYDKGNSQGAANNDLKEWDPGQNISGNSEIKVGNCRCLWCWIGAAVTTTSAQRDELSHLLYLCDASSKGKSGLNLLDRPQNLTLCCAVWKGSYIVTMAASITLLLGMAMTDTDAVVRVSQCLLANSGCNGHSVHVLSSGSFYERPKYDTQSEIANRNDSGDTNDVSSQLVLILLLRYCSGTGWWHWR